MKKKGNHALFSHVACHSIVLKMKLTLVLFSFSIFQMMATSGFSQGKIELDFEETPLSEVLEEIKSQTSYKFFYINDEVNLNQKATIQVNKETLDKVLELLFNNTDISYSIIGKQVILKKTHLLNEQIELQREIKGNVKDSNGNLLPGANILVKGTTIGAQTDFDGNFAINLSGENNTLIVSYIGFETTEVDVTGKDFVEVVLQDAAAQLEDVILVGSRNPSRTATETAVPIDVIDITQIATQGPQTSINEILNYAAPSFTSQTQTVSDGTDHIDPASLRGLGPDQVLVLINGKRRHNTSLVNVNGTVGAGSVGTDMNAIPTAAIQRIEVLRDGAAAQYGSDAIAGVINIVLKKATGKLDLTLTTGANFSENSNQFDGDSDGEKVKLEANYGLALGENGGFINFTGSLSTREPALRNRDYQGDIFKGFHGAERVFAAGGGNVAEMTLADYQTAAQGITYLDQGVKDQIAALDVNNPADVDTFRGLLDIDVDEAELTARGLTRTNFRFKVGTAKLREGKFFANMSIPLSDDTEIYSFGGISYRQGLASGFYRRPAQGDGRANTPAFPNGFLPNIGTDIVDKSIALGIKGKIKDWSVDFSNTYGINIFDITVGNSSNGTLGVATPRTFDAGALSFMQNTTNLDISKFHEDIFEGFNVAIGAEYKVENYSITAGEEASYTSYDINGNPVTSTTPDNELVQNNFTGAVLGGGSQVFRGYDPNNETDKYRNSIAGYIDLEVDFTKQWLVSLAGRYENYSDFGDTFNYKLATRYKISDNFSVRGANSTGFRAPSLHQQFFSRTSTVFVDNQPFEQGTFTNDSRAATLIGIAKLKEETSTSFSLGLTAKIQNFTITADAYLINIDDRIVYSGSFGNGGEAELTQIFEDAGATSARFFVNAIDTKSQGIDVVISHKADFGENTTLKNDLSATFAETEVEEIRIPARIANAGQGGNFFDAQEEAFLTLAQPRTKLSLTNALSIGRYNVLLRNVFFGEVTDPDDFNGDPRVEGTVVSDDAIYGGKVVTDLSVSGKIFENLNITIGANNLLDVYPDENRAGGTAGDQFVYSRRTSQFGYTGRFLFARINISL
ncbi:iron complex outermembrane receptor protein [Aquimarina sp. MAR_2010_214]|uniref:TonB-dependent receptor n=1 Tax=Aquimarina sp. MAR_2010_214 TaxID=1250026 RepID=UPI000C702536|nr:TonB-dependent receptor [Aquimarina sp. MAR_2010_214]PKV50067.1 iron complex outermembrane receptor protein [Aquimarina sp. MAR_2010_214]